jgi:hypothetical protein
MQYHEKFKRKGMVLVIPNIKDDGGTGANSIQKL